MGLFGWLFGRNTKNKSEDTRLPFIIEVSADQDKADLSPENLRITHVGCGNGVMKKNVDPLGLDLGTGSLPLRCERCRVEIHVDVGEYGIGALCNTARDGRDRWLRGGFDSGVCTLPESKHREREPEFRGILVRLAGGTGKQASLNSERYSASPEP